MTPLRPLHHAFGARVEDIPFTASDGTRLGLTRVAPEDGSTDRPVVLILHGLTASADMFTLPETRNLVDVLLDAGYEPWLLDWRQLPPAVQRGPGPLHLRRRRAVRHSRGRFADQGTYRRA